LERSFYDILDLKPYASLQEVKLAFKKLAVMYHPDKNPGNQLAEERFKEISNAYQVLGEEESKRNYDLRLSGYRNFIKTQEKESPEAKRKKMREELLRRKKAAAEKKIVEDWNRLQHGIPPVHWRRALNYCMIVVGAFLIYQNWFYTMETLSPFSYLVATVFILLGNVLEQNLNYTRYLYDEFKGKINFNIPRRIVRNLVLGLFLGISSGIFAAHFMALYHFKYYSEVTTGKIEVNLNGPPIYQYCYYVEGKKYIKPLPQKLIDQRPLETERIWVRYSSKNPVFAKVITD